MGPARHDDPVIADLIRNPEVKGGANNKTTQPTESPSPLMETFAKSIHAVLSNYGYDTAQDRSRVGENL